MAESVAEALSRAVAAHQAGRLAEAEAGYRTVLARAPGQADALNLLGVLSAGRGDHAAAVGLYDRAIAALPKFADVYFNKANTLAALGDVAGAEAGLRTALKHNPRFADAWLNLGTLLAKAGQGEAAIEAYRSLIRCAEGDPRGHFNLGRCLIDQKRAAEALVPLKRALALDPNAYDAHLALGDAFADLGKRDDASVHLAHAARIKPEAPEPIVRMGTAASDDGDLAAALTLYDRAAQLSPKHYSARVNRGLARLARGEFTPGWADYAERHFDSDFKNKRSPRPIPAWKGQDLRGKSILVTGDQGLGDEILYAGMMPELVQRGAAVTLACASRLVRLFARSFPNAAVIPDSDIDPDTQFDFHSSLIDLGQWMRPDISRFPNRSRYLVADHGHADAFRRWCDERRRSGRLVIGCSWRSSNPDIGKQKSIQLLDWAGLFQVSAVDWINIQYGDWRPEIEAYHATMGALPFAVQGFDRDHDLDQLAAHLAALDLVITVSNTTAHLAAAFGVPTWIVAPTGKGALWYWFDRGGFTPWYSSVRVVRVARHQPRTEVIARLSAAVAAMVSSASGGPRE